MIVKKLTHRMFINSKIMMRFSGGYHEKVYDWRDDLSKNLDMYEDPRMIGVIPAS